MNSPELVVERHRTRRYAPDLEHLYQRIEDRKIEMLNDLESLIDEQRRMSPGAAQWSPLQVMEHVVTVEEWMAGPNAAALPTNAKVQLRGHLFILLGAGAMRRGLRMPTLPMAEPRGDLTFTAIRQRWDEARIGLAAKIAAVTPETRSQPISLHPAAGPLNATQVLVLLDAHLAYHWQHFPPAKP